MNDSGEHSPGSEPQPIAASAPQPSPAWGYPPPQPYPFPLTFSQIIDRVVFLMRTNLRLLLGVALIPFAALFLLAAGPMGLIVYQAQHNLVPGAPPDLPWFYYPILLLVSVLGFLVNGFYLAAGSHAALSADCGIRLTVSHCLHLAWERAGRNVGLMLLMTLYAMAPLLLIVIAAIPIAILAAVFHPGSPAAAFFLMPLFMLAFIGAYVWMFILMLRLSLAFPASVAEDLTAVEAIRRSGRLTRGAKGRIFLVMLIGYAGIYLLMLLCSAVVFAFIALAAFALSGLHLNLVPPWSYLGFALLIPVWIAFMVLWTGVPMAAITTTLAVFYRDQRLRIDGCGCGTIGSVSTAWNG